MSTSFLSRPGGVGILAPGRTLWLGLFVALCGPAWIPGAAAQDPATIPQGTVEYAVKVMCGPTVTPMPPVAPGRYFTAINVHNPGPSITAMRYKIALTGPTRDGSPQSGPISGFVSGELRPDAVLEIDCRHVLPRARELVRDVQFVKGFVVIQAPSEFDVVAVYTVAGPTTRVQAIEIERIPPRRLSP